MILTVPDYIPINLFTYFSYFLNLFTLNSLPIKKKEVYHTTIYGYSCRSIFELIMEFYRNKRVFTTPIHHTSFRNIIEKYVDKENLFIININDNFNKLEETDYSKCNVVVVSHLFGQDFYFKELAEAKEKYGFVVIEDRVQGGSHTIPFSDRCVDISLYSMGMDKRPVAMGGGFVNIRDNCEDIINYLEYKINSLPKETIFERALNLIKNIPTYLIYNYKLIFYYISSLLCLMGFTVLNSVQKYREKNPGFTHNNYLKSPSDALLISMYRNHNSTNYLRIENHISKQYNNFYSKFSKDEKKILFPWLIKNYTYTIYNTVYIPSEKEEKFLDLAVENRLAFINNPTYKVFNEKHITYEKRFRDINKQMYYLPCIYNMDESDMEELYLLLKNVLDD